ncbi:MAG TPA: metalloregulator ArsR/SmtB family transcription factor [Acidimicrobiales bacterium]
MSYDLLDPQMEAIFDALGDRTRRLIVKRLEGGPLPVVDIARDMPVARPAISQHLQVLKAAGLVVDRPAGNRRIYALDPEGLVELRRFIESFWEDALTRFARFAEKGIEPTQ